MRNHLLAGTALSLAVLGAAACSIDVEGAMAVAREERVLTVTGAPELDIRTFDGSIQVRSWDEPNVRVEIERRGPDSQNAAALVVNVTQTGNRIVVEAPRPSGSSGFRFGPGRSVHFVVMTPKRMTLAARTGDGSITVETLTGTIDLTTGDGAIRANDLEGRLKAHTGDGSIRADRLSGSVDADTGDGAIDLTGRLDGVTLKTGDGSIRLTAEDGSMISSPWTLATGDGAIDLRVPEAMNADLDAQTNDGRITADDVFGLPVARGRNNLQGRVGAGGPVLRLRTGDGSIAIRR
jgi:hypothetical protein